MKNESAPRLLVMMAHPDDCEFLVAGTLLQLKSVGWEIGIASMTAGDCGSTTHSKAEISRIRFAEARAAADYIGAWYACAGLMDIEIFANAENQRKVVEITRMFDPDAVITHSPVDYLIDHEETCRLARSAAFAAAMPLYETHHDRAAKEARVTPALYYADPVEGIDSMGRRVFPQFYVDITQVMEQKRRMLSLHHSQREWLRQHHGMDEYVGRMTAWAAQYGREAGFGYAEGLRQHLGHGYPRQPMIQDALAHQIRVRE